MFGAFNLRDGHDLTSFKTAFDRFSEHLVQQGFVHAWQVWHRAYHDGYDARFPEVSVLVEMRFHDHTASLACWNYVEAGTEPLKSQHIAVNQQVSDPIFALFHALR
ncbi:hypothetical protein M3P21_16375 [Ruegeria sp. 2012CJ41-6]|uniref:NIPSNAP domain-containing protein n=1 Tax=Ruegeria spongiae TaxID=2942209 RepID=A0ABT0Q6T2_9RHOB|nr:DUF6614 family protein [Ruegeria spongiae]MCL6285107.1 hypothetical protein [Ruegeria spongiae]